MVAAGQLPGTGAGVGADVGAADSPTHKNSSGSLGFRPEMKPVLPVESIVARMFSEVMLGLFSSNNAAPPDTWGHAIEVPLKDLDPVSEEDDAETMSEPGAMMLLQLP